MNIICVYIMNIVKYTYIYIYITDADQYNELMVILNIIGVEKLTECECEEENDDF